MSDEKNPPKPQEIVIDLTPWVVAMLIMFIVAIIAIIAVTRRDKVCTEERWGV